MRKNDDVFNVLLDINVVFVVWLPMKQKRMGDNGWMYSGRVSVTTRSDEWMWKTRMLVKELARGKRIAELCPCSRCNKRHRQGHDEMYIHLTRNGYMRDYVPPIDFAERERDRYDVLRQRLNGNDYDGIRDFLNDFVDAEAAGFATFTGGTARTGGTAKTGGTGANREGVLCYDRSG